MSAPDVIIIGTGPAGLACATAMRTLGSNAMVLEKAGTVGSVWRSHYDRLHLHTDRNHSGLPGMAMPRDYPTYPSRAGRRISRSLCAAFRHSTALQHRCAASGAQRRGLACRNRCGGIPRAGRCRRDRDRHCAVPALMARRRGVSGKHHPQQRIPQCLGFCRQASSRGRLRQFRRRDCA